MLEGDIRPYINTYIDRGAYCNYYHYLYHKYILLITNFIFCCIYKIAHTCKKRWKHGLAFTCDKEIEFRGS